MSESEFIELSDAALARLEAALEGCGADIDFELKDGGILELEFGNGTKIIVNRHAAAQEIWVAAKSGGYHYRWDGVRWVDTRGGEELFAALTRYATAQAGEPIALT
jgi:CyaY protein